MRHPDPIRRRPSLAWPVALALALCAPAAAQADAGREWREQVDALIDRWSDAQGGARLMRALDVLDKRLQQDEQDGEALLEKCRLRLALPRPYAKDPHEAAQRAVGHYRSIVEDADRAVDLLEGDRKHAALALGFLAATYQLHAELRLLELIPDNPKSKALLAEKDEQLQKRRRTLELAVGEEGAQAQLVSEGRRQETLKQLDALGEPPRPIGQADTLGEAVDLTAYRGRVLLVLFWSTRFDDARALVHQVEALRAELGAQGFEVLGVNLDDAQEAMLGFLAEEGIGSTWRHVFEGRGLASSVARAWGVRSLPDGVLVDHAGRVRYVRPWELNLRLAVEDLLLRRAEAEKKR